MQYSIRWAFVCTPHLIPLATCAFVYALDNDKATLLLLHFFLFLLLLLLLPLWRQWKWHKFFKMQNEQQSYSLKEESCRVRKMVLGMNILQWSCAFVRWILKFFPSNYLKKMSHIEREMENILKNLCTLIFMWNPVGNFHSFPYNSSKKKLNWEYEESSWDVAVEIFHTHSFLISL